MAPSALPPKRLSNLTTPLHPHSSWPGADTTEHSSDSHTSLLTHLLALISAYTDTKVTFLIHRSDHITPLLKLLMLALRSSMILRFFPPLRVIPASLCVSLWWGGGSCDRVQGLCKPLRPSERVGKHKASRQNIKEPAQLPVNSWGKNYNLSQGPGFPANELRKGSQREFWCWTGLGPNPDSDS